MSDGSPEDGAAHGGTESFTEQVTPEALESARRDARYEALASRDDYAHNLLRAAVHYRKNHDLEPLTLVQWKPRMRNAEYPHYGRPMVVLGASGPEMLPTNSLFPIPPEEHLATLLVAFLDAENDFAIIRVDPQRVQPWKTMEGSDPPGA